MNKSQDIMNSMNEFFAPNRVKSDEDIDQALFGSIQTAKGIMNFLKKKKATQPLAIHAAKALAEFNSLAVQLERLGFKIRR